jgi:hypothetical protein
MILHATSPCSWESPCKVYHIRYQFERYSKPVWIVTTEGYADFHALSLTEAQEACERYERLREPIPEMDFNTHAEMTR